MKNRRLPLPLCLLIVLFYSGCNTKPVTEPTTGEFMILSDELSNQGITCFGEDGFGYIWIGTRRGANKYNGHQFLQYYHTHDSTSLSYNQVRCIFSDSRGRLWIATRFGINQMNAQGVFSRMPITTSNQNVHQIAETDNRRIFINTADVISEFIETEGKFIPRITLTGGKMAYRGFHIDKANRLWTVGYNTICCFDSDSFEEIASWPVGEAISTSCLRPNGELWLSAGNRLIILDLKSGNFIPAPAAYHLHPVLARSTISLIYSYEDVSLLINTQKDGLFLLNTYNGEIFHQSEPGFPFTIPETEITVLFTDSNKNLWIGSFDQGFKMISSNRQRFNQNDYLRKQTERKSVTSLATDKEQNLWIATRINGLMVWEKSSQEVRNIDMSEIFGQSLQFKERVNSVFVDSGNAIWLLTDFRVIRCRYTNKRLVREAQFRIGSMNTMSEDYQGTIWTAGSTGDLYYLEKSSAEFQKIPVGLPQGINFTNSIITLSGGKVLAACFMQNLKLIDPVTKTMEEIPILPLIPKTIFVPTVLYEDGSGDVWIGSNGNGLFRYNQQTKKVEKIEEIACKEISGIIEDVQGNVWISTLFGLFKYDRTVNTITGYYTGDGIGGSQFNERSAARMPDNSLVFGGTHGITIFNPIDVSVRRTVPLYVEELKIHNKRLRPESGGIIETAMLLNPEVRLAHDDNNIQLSYVALDYSEYPSIQYAYRLEGFDHQWIEARDYRQAFYSNLPPGRYTFHVRATNDDKTVAEVSTSIPIYITRPPWLAIPALCLYIVIIGGLAYLILRMYNRIITNRRETQLALQEKEHEKHLNQMNMSFFANISHEFRTPLTLIAGPVSTLCQDERIEDDNKRLLYTVQSSVKRMLRLVNQILDFHKLEHDALKLQVKETDIVRTLKGFIDMFGPNAVERGITLSVYGLEDSFITWVDGDKLEKITINLINNAIKYTPKGGRITICFDIISHKEALLLCKKLQENPESEYVKITVEDTGPGIPPDETENIFKRYYQLNYRNKGEINWGTGIGLYYSRRLSELHHGYLFAGNKKDASGSVFTLLLPTARNIYPDKEIENHYTPETTYAYLSSEVPVMLSSHAEDNKDTSIKPTLLVVDDETEITRYLKDLFSPSYHVVCCFNAESAWTEIEETVPDLIVSDVIMPGTDGYTLCKRIKENITTCHIPVILLTAKVSVSEQVDGLNVGANAYVTKPFEPDYLAALIKSQLRNRDNARRLLSDTTQADTISEDILSATDKAFMESLYNIMEKELSNPELNITRLTETLHISRTKLYYKIKGLTGENPKVFFLTYKLNRAAELIREGRHTMSEISDMTGFNTPSYFSTSFKKKFGISPSKYQ